MVELPENVIGDGFKFLDYFSSIDTEEFHYSPLNLNEMFSMIEKNNNCIKKPS